MLRLYSAAFLVLLAVALSPPPARAQAPARHLNGSLGFHHVEAPLGGRWWLSGQRIGLDGGIGFSSVPSTIYSDEKLQSWAFEFGVPIVLRSWDRVHFMVRPGLLWRTEEFVISAPPARFDTDNLSQFDLSGELEVELFLADNVSVSASHGIALSIADPPGPGGSQTSLNTLGNNFTTIGFHIYFFGGSE
jgi:hypothetical protein